MKKLIVLSLLFVAACAPFFPTPNDFPTPPSTVVIVEFPNYTATPTFAPIPQPITSNEMSDAENFLLKLKANVTAGVAEEIADSVLYPIHVRLNGQSTRIDSKAAFMKNYGLIFDQSFINTLATANENNLVVSAEGIRVGNGELWFNLFCMDTACTKKEFLITQINN